MKVIPNNHTTKVKWCHSKMTAEGNTLPSSSSVLTSKAKDTSKMWNRDCKDVNLCCQEESVELGRNTKRQIYICGTQIRNRE